MLKRALVFLFCLEGSLIVHEGAHFVVMQANGVEVEEVSLGIGPVLYQKQFADYKFSVKLIPLMAYVMPSKRGMETMEKLPLIQIILIDLAGVFSNLLLASLIFLGLKSREPSVNLPAVAFSLPKNFFLLFKDSLFGMLTFGIVKPKNNGVLVLENSPSSLGYSLLWMNLMLGILNLLPAQMLDGGQVAFMFLRMALNAARENFGVSARSIVIIYQIFNFVTLYMLIMLIFNGLRIKFVEIKNTAKV